MKLQPVRKREFRIKKYIRSVKYWLFSLIGLGASILTLTGCSGRGRRLMGVQPYFEEKLQDTLIIDNHLGGEAPVVDSFPLGGTAPIDDTHPLRRDKSPVDSVQSIPVDTTEVIPFNHLPGDIAPIE